MGVKLLWIYITQWVGWGCLTITRVELKSLPLKFFLYWICILIHTPRSSSSFRGQLPKQATILPCSGNLLSYPTLHRLCCRQGCYSHPVHRYDHTPLPEPMAPPPPCLTTPALASMATFLYKLEETWEARRSQSLNLLLDILWSQHNNSDYNSYTCSTRIAWD
jgi:hypothetical protein